MTAWKILQREQVLFTDPKYSDDLFRPFYRWMTKQMECRIGFKPEAVSLPLWAWYQYDGIERRKPAQRGARIKFEQSDKGVLLSDFGLWNYVLNDQYLPRTTADYEAFEAFENNLFAGRLPVRAYQQGLREYSERKEDSWNRIFDLDWVAEGITTPYEEKRIQATFWELHFDQIKDVQVFTAR